MKRKRPGRIKTIAIVIGCVLLSPVIVPFCLIEHALVVRRRKRDADNFNCIRCGMVLGQDAIARADEYWRNHVRDLHARFPGSRFRLIRNVWAICIECDARYNYHTKDKAYFLQPDMGNEVADLGD